MSHERRTIDCHETFAAAAADAAAAAPDAAAAPFDFILRCTLFNVCPPVASFGCLLHHSFCSVSLRQA